MPSILLAVKHAQLDLHNLRLREQIARDTARDTATHDTTIHMRKGATAGGDERKLRGIPCIARGVPGHIPGTRP